MAGRILSARRASLCVAAGALPHALLSYLFGTILIAVAINLVTNLGQS
jgi:uncharacterized membrane protein